MEVGSRPLQEMDRGDSEARRWNAEKEAIEAYRDSPSGRGLQGKVIAQKMYAPTNEEKSEDSETSPEKGKILTDDREPGISTHIHLHEGNITISTKDQVSGKVERYNLNTGDSFEKNVHNMSPQEAQRRMRSEHTDHNPNPDKDTIPGFHSSVWSKSSSDKENQEHEE